MVTGFKSAGMIACGIPKPFIQGRNARASSACFKRERCRNKSRDADASPPFSARMEEELSLHVSFRLTYCIAAHFRLGLSSHSSFLPLVGLETCWVADCIFFWSSQLSAHTLVSIKMRAGKQIRSPTVHSWASLRMRFAYPANAKRFPVGTVAPSCECVSHYQSSSLGIVIFRERQFVKGREKRNKN
jgi:hypothetical protein